MLAFHVTSNPVAEDMLFVRKANIAIIPEYKYHAGKADIILQILPANEGVYFKQLSGCYLSMLTDQREEDSLSSQWSP